MIRPRWVSTNPSWLTPIGTYFGEAPELAPRGSLLAPTLIHGAGLAVCWLSGALAGRMFEREAFTLAGDEKFDGGGKGEGNYAYKIENACKLMIDRGQS